MRSRTSIPNRAACPRAGLLRLLADSQRGFTIIEVVVSALIVASVAGAAATALIATSRMSGDQRRRSQADQIAQQDQERLRGMSIKALSGFTETRVVDEAGKTPVTGYQGTKFTVHSTGRYLSSAGGSSCSSSGSGAAAYVLIRSEVNWQSNLKTGDVSNVASWAANSIRPPISQESLITPAAGGTLLVNVVDQDNQPLSNVTVDLFGPKESQSAVTGSEGCIIIGALSPTGYYVGAKRTGYVDANGNDWPFGGASVSQTGTSFPTPNPFKLGWAGSITAEFKTTVGTTLIDQKAPSISWQDNQSGMSASQNVVPGTVPTTPIPTPVKLFPFNNGTPGVYTSNYTVWAGSCDAARPPIGQETFATVGPGGTPTLLDGAGIKVPALVVKVSYPTAGTHVTPNHIQLKNSCNQKWTATGADIRPTADANFGTRGHLAFPGQPYGTYTICAAYDPPGSTPMKQATVSGVANTNFAAGNPTAAGQAITITDATNGSCNLP